MTALPVGVVVPAWNEAQSLPLLLGDLLRQEGVALEVVVVANGCSDSTAVVAGAFAPKFLEAGHVLSIVELDRASKAAALRAGDAQSRGFPRAYIDADVRLTPNALRGVADVLAADDPRLAAPRLAFARSCDSATAKLATFVEGLPPFSDDVVGGGFYAVNEAGRARWDAMPDLIADDAYVASRFDSGERHLVLAATFEARFPESAAVCAVLERWALGRLQLARAGHRLQPAPRARQAWYVLLRPRHWGTACRWYQLTRRALRAAQRRSASNRFAWSRADGKGSPHAI